MNPKTDCLAAAGVQPLRPVHRPADRRETPAVGRVVWARDPRYLAAANRRTLVQAQTIDRAKVARVRAAIESGTYAIDADAIAARLLDVQRTLQ